MTKEQYKRLLRLRQSQEAMLFVLMGELGVQQALKVCNMPSKRIWYILYKWTGKGFYNYGVSVAWGRLETKYLPLQGI